MFLLFSIKYQIKRAKIPNLIYENEILNESKLVLFNKLLKIMYNQKLKKIKK